MNNDEHHVSRWHHAPLHVFAPDMVYMITAGTVGKAHFFRNGERLALLQNALLGSAEACGWEPRAWAVFSNHYHFVGRAPAVAGAGVSILIQKLHSETARAVNMLDHTECRPVWHQYWDKCLSFERSYLPRLKYTNHNAVHHKLVAVARDYPYCSAAWLDAQPSGFRRKVDSFGCERLNEPDEFEPTM